MLGVTQFFVTANYVEAALWAAMGTGFVVHALRTRSSSGTSIVAAVAFFLFAVSDVVETRTGAWWRPWLRTARGRRWWWWTGQRADCSRPSSKTFSLCL